MKPSNELVLKRTGGWYIPLAILASEIIGLLGTIPGLALILVTTSPGEELRRAFVSLLPILLIISQGLILAAIWRLTPDARDRLNQWRQGIPHADEAKEFAAWKQITNITTQYGVIALVVNLIVLLLPPFIITLAQEETLGSIFQPTSLSASLPVYIFLGGFASILGWIILTLLTVERLTLPARLILLPQDFEIQFKGRTSVLLGFKFQILLLSLIVIGLAVVAPIGFRQIIRALYTDALPLQIFRDLQIQSILLSISMLLLGGAFSYFATRSISDPVKDLIETFQKIEQGDLKQRVPVTATDELATVAMHFNRMVARLEDLQSTLEQQVKDRTKQLTATIEVGRVAASILDVDQLLNKVANLITDRFGYYYTAIYILDPTEKWAELREATGQAGSVLKQNRHRLEISGKSMVAGCIREKMPRIIQNTAAEKQRFENPLLPYTRSEIALPLMVGDRVLGALNIHSTKAADFDTEIIETMQNVASQISVALENARLFQEAQQSIQELQAIQKQYLLEGWSNVRSYNDALEYEIGEPSEAASQVLQSVIELRNQVFGQITLEGHVEWTPEQRSLVDAVAAQAAIALENARLVSESRQIAQRERALAEINSKIWTSGSVDGILQTVVKELGKRLDASAATIELKLDEEHDHA
ncbi:MAG: GAF domain-containing protein [Chloroflexota bacterium]|nr:GAF domain-containing protein [Chloroflexota bacterium]MBI5704211.1 GAF domain-containing protein [Chloroflexota bacterium]